MISRVAVVRAPLVSAGRLAEFEPTANGGGRLMTTRRPEDLVEVATLAVPESA